MSTFEQWTNEVNEWAETLSEKFSNQGVFNITKNLAKNKEFYMVEARIMLYERLNVCYWIRERRKEVKESLDHLLSIDIKNFGEKEFYDLGVETARYFQKEWVLWQNLVKGTIEMSEDEIQEIDELTRFLYMICSALMPQRAELSNDYTKAFFAGRTEFLGWKRGSPTD